MKVLLNKVHVTIAEQTKTSEFRAKKDWFQGQARRTGDSGSRILNSATVFREKFLQAKFRVRVEGCVTFFWLVGGEVTRWWPRNLVLCLKLPSSTWVGSLVTLFSHVQLFVTPWTVALQTPLSMGFSRHKYWSGLPFPSPGYLPDPGIWPRSPILWADSLPPEPAGKPLVPSEELKSIIRYITSGELGPCLEDAQLFPDYSSFVSSFPVGKCLNLPFGSQGRPGRLKEAYFLQTRNGAMERIHTGNAPQGPAWFQSSFFFNFLDGSVVKNLL